MGKQDYQEKHDVHQGTTAGTPQNNLPNQGNGAPNGGSASSDGIKMVQGKPGIGGSTSHLGK